MKTVIRPETEMKDSGASWIGKVPCEWNISKLKWHLRRIDPRNPGNKQVLSLYREYGIIPKDSRDDNHNVTSEDTSKYKYVRVGDFVVNKMKAWQGSVAVSEYDGVVSPAYYVYHFIDDSYYKRYFHYLLRSCYKEEFMRMSGGIRIGQWDLSSDDLDNVLVIIPSKEEQKKIADYLDKTCSQIDEIVAEARESIDEYKGFKQSVIFEAVTKGVNSNIKLKNSGNEWIGMMPINKRLTKVKYCGDFKKGPFGSAITKDMFVEKGTNTFKVYEQKNAIYLDYTLGYYYISEDKYRELQAFAIKPGDIIVSCAGTIGKTYILPDNCDAGIINQALMRIRLYDRIDRTYFSYLFESLLEYAGKKYSNGSAIKNIPPFAILNNLWIVDFDIEEQLEIVKYLNMKLPQIDTCIAEKESLINELEAYKKSLIYEVVTGKRRVI